jgi:hypothetical protein
MDKNIEGVANKEDTESKDESVNDSDYTVNVTPAETSQIEETKNIDNDAPDDECDIPDDECDVPDDETDGFDPNIKSMMNRNSFNANKTPNMVDAVIEETRKVSDTGIEDEFTIINQSSCDDAKESTD